MTAGMKLITLKSPTFFARMRRTWLLWKSCWAIWAECVKALWCSGRTASFKAINLRSGLVVTVTVAKDSVTVMATKEEPSL